jgi:hypothetical protein
MSRTDWTRLGISITLLASCGDDVGTAGDSGDSTAAESSASDSLDTVDSTSAESTTTATTSEPTTLDTVDSTTDGEDPTTGVIDPTTDGSSSDPSSSSSSSSDSGQFTASSGESSSSGDESSTGADDGVIPECPGASGGGDTMGEGCSAADAAGIASSISFVPHKVLRGADDLLYLFDDTTPQIVRWSLADGVIEPAIDLAGSAYDLAYSPELDTLYVGHYNGDITRIELELGLDEEPFATLMGTPLGLQVVGDYLLAVDDEGAWESHHVFDADGFLVTSAEWNHPSRDYAWSPANERLYYFRDSSSPNDLMWEQIDGGTGLIVADGESPYHGAFDIEPPIRVSSDGAFVLLGTGHIYDGTSIERPAAIPVHPIDAMWTDEGFVTIAAGSAETTIVERWDPTTWARADARQLDGVPVAVVGGACVGIVITRVAGDLRFHAYQVGDDGDGDGLVYAEDALPLDPAASVDTDRDGAPDVWNTDCSEVESITGLVLDDHPDLAACTAAGPCDVGDVPLSAAPTDAVVDDAGTIYMLAGADGRILRWSSTDDAWMDPIPVGSDALHLALHSGTPTLLVGHASGWIGRIDIGGAAGEHHFATLPEPPHGLELAGDFVLSADATGAWDTHSTFDLSGVETARVDWNQESGFYAWSSVVERMYFFRDGTSPNDLMFEDIDQMTGAIVADGDSPYHGDYVIQGPIAVSTNGALVLIGTGQLYDAWTLQHEGFLAEGDLTDAVWGDAYLLTLRDEGGQARAEQWSLALALEESTAFAGVPYRVFDTPVGRRVVTLADEVPTVWTW